MSQSDMIVELEAWRATQVVFTLKLDSVLIRRSDFVVFEVGRAPGRPQNIPLEVFFLFQNPIKRGFLSFCCRRFPSRRPNTGLGCMNELAAAAAVAPMSVDDGAEADPVLEDTPGACCSR